MMIFAELHENASEESVEELEDLIDSIGGLASQLPPPNRTILRVTGVTREALEPLRQHSAVARWLDIDGTHPLVSRGRFESERTVCIGGAEFGGIEFGVIAGPCSVESRDQLLAAAKAVLSAGAVALRGGAYKPRTSPYDFQGLGPQGIALLNHARNALNVPVVTEAMAPAEVEPMYEYIDVYQVGARNMQNYALLKALAVQDKPVLLKRGPGSTLKEWLLAAEYIVSGGNENVILCERGIRSYETANRYTLDLAGAKLAQQKTWLPVIVDPSHATGRPELIPAMSYASLAAGLDGLIVEVHPKPTEALSDGPQALVPQQFEEMMTQLRAIAPAVGRSLRPPQRDVANLSAREIS